MAMLPRTAIVVTIGLICWSQLATPAFTAESKVGVASAVKNQVQGRGSRQLAAGSEVFSNERIRTGDASSAQFMFLDKTVMSLGPKAELMLDKFVYDPNKGSGQVVVNAVQGSFRFVTGSQNPNNYSIKTPVATLGIRGTVIDLTIRPSGETVVGVLEGQVTIRFRDGSTMTLVKGQSITIASNGTPKGKIEAYDGNDPNAIDVAVPGGRIDDINQLNAIQGRAYVAPVPTTSPCYYCNY